MRSRTHRWAAALAALVVVLPVHAAPEAGPGSAACRAALDDVAARENALATRAGQPGEAERGRLADARRRAARICLGGDGRPAPPTGLARAPIEVPPVAVPSLRLPVPAPVPPAITPKDAAPRVTNCDAAGCWLSDGSYRSRDRMPACPPNQPFVLCRP